MFRFEFVRRDNRVSYYFCGYVCRRGKVYWDFVRGFEFSLGVGDSDIGDKSF